MKKEIEDVIWIDGDDDVNELIHKELGEKLISAEILVFELFKLAKTIKNDDARNGICAAANLAWTLPDARENNEI